MPPNIADRNRAEERQREYERVVEGLAELILVVDRNYRVALANRAYLQHRDLPKEHVLGRSIADLLDNDIFETVIKKKLDESFAGKVVQYEMSFPYPGLGLRHMFVSYFPIDGPSGVDRIACVLHDITDRKRAEDALRLSEERYRSLVHASANTVWTFQAGPDAVDLSSWSEYTGQPIDDARGAGWLQMIHPDDREETARVWSHAVENRAIYERVHRVRTRSGDYRHIAVRGVPLLEKDGTLREWIGSGTDITDRMRAKEALRETERSLRVLIENLPDCIARFDAHCRLVFSSPSAQKLFGGPRNLGRTLPELAQLPDPALATTLDSLIQQALATGESNHIEVSLPTPHGPRFFDIRHVPEKSETGNVVSVLGIAHDITDRKHAEDALRQSEERLLLAQEVAQMGAYDRNFLTGESRWTPQMERLYGIPPGHVPLAISNFLDLIHPDDRPEVSRLLEQSMQSGEAHGEWRVLWPNGTLHWIAGRWRVFKDVDGKPLRMIGIDYDITDRKRIEEELRLAKEKLTEEKLYLEREITSSFGFDEIIGQSPALMAVMESVSNVASTDATVLLLGETGTGKELVARAIHRLSRRSANPFIKMNCAAIPSGLLESELFGNEKGAFTGAIGKKIGRLELADKGTIFLDEIGEISLDLQPKLLRILQDHEFERLGGVQTLTVDFRLIAATNRDLAQRVRDREFRSDLFYRLNVFPIFLPPLRERREDIPLLVEHFVRKISKRIRKNVTSIPAKTMDALVQWHWPGNVRELENFLERSLILTTGSVLAAPLRELQSVSPSPSPQEPEDDDTLKNIERRHILQALKESRGLISGPRGAAARLGLKRTTLQSKIKQLGINPRHPPAGL